MEEQKIKCPSDDECNSHAKIYDSENQFGLAFYYPQMGGYYAKAVALFDKHWQDSGMIKVGGCVEVYVWHDGEFPIMGDLNPAILHHCDPQQFIDFGEWMREVNNRQKG